MKLYMTFIVFLIYYGNSSAQTRDTSSHAGQRSAVPVDASVRFKPSQKGQLSLAQPSSFAALPATKQTAPPATPTLTVVPSATFQPDSHRLETTHTNKSLYPIKNVTLKVE